MEERFICLTLLTSARDETKLLTTIKNVFGENSFHVVEEGDKVSYTLFDYSRYVVNIASDEKRKDFFNEQKSGMLGFYSSLECKKSNIKEILLNQITSTNSLYYISFAITEEQDRTKYLENVTFKIAQEMNACILLPNKDILTSKGELFMAHTGESNIDNYIIKVDTDSLYIRGSLSNIDKEVYNKSKDILKEKDIPHLETMRLALRDSEINLKSIDEVCKRAVSLFTISHFSDLLLSHKGYTTAKQATDELITKFNLETNLSNFEGKYLKTDNIPNELRNRFIWGYEASVCLFYSIGLIKELQPFNALANIQEILDLLNSVNNMDELISKAQYKSKMELFELQDLIMRYHWAIVEARLNNQTIEGFEEGIVGERHKALNWILTDIFGKDWDKIETPS